MNRARIAPSDGHATIAGSGVVIRQGYFLTPVDGMEQMGETTESRRCRARSAWPVRSALPARSAQPARSADSTTSFTSDLASNWRPSASGLACPSIEQGHQRGAGHRRCIRHVGRVLLNAALAATVEQILGHGLRRKRCAQRRRAWIQLPAPRASPLGPGAHRGRGGGWRPLSGRPATPQGGTRQGRCGADRRHHARRARLRRAHRSGPASQSAASR